MFREDPRILDIIFYDLDIKNETNGRMMRKTIFSFHINNES